MKKYKCEIPDCEREVVIRSKIKNRESEYFGKMACPICAEKHNVRKEKLQSEKTASNQAETPTRYASSKVKTIKKQTEKNKSKRKEERADYPEFFKKHIEYIKENNVRCCECGDRLRGDVSEISHIISKRNNKEVATLDGNILYLCGMHSENQCHSRFDSSLSNREKMKCFSQAVLQFNSFRDKIVNITKEVLQLENAL